MKRYWDKANSRLVYTGKSSNPDYWNNHWGKEVLKRNYSNIISLSDYVVNTTKKYLEPDSFILEGGCGLAYQVYKLHKSGFKVLGIDYADKTVKLVKQVKPELDIRLGDVRNLDFDNNTFDAYWSFGVIEHFYNGYDDIVKEMFRVIKPNGYLFITFPHISFLRKQKAKKNKYPEWNESSDEIKLFYQFALNHEGVVKDLEKHGFYFIEKQYIDGVKGLKDEIKLLHKPFSKIYGSKNVFNKIIAKLISVMSSKLASHSILLVLRKNKNDISYY